MLERSALAGKGREGSGAADAARHAIGRRQVEIPEHLERFINEYDAAEQPMLVLGRQAVQHCPILRS
jgi:hypothetical protein